MKISNRYEESVLTRWEDCDQKTELLNKSGKNMRDSVIERLFPELKHLDLYSLMYELTDEDTLEILMESQSLSFEDVVKMIEDA